MPWFRSDAYKEEFFTGMQENETLEQFLDRHVRPDTNFLNKCSRVIDKVVKLIHKHPKYSVNQVIKVHVNIRYYKYLFIQTEITKSFLCSVFKFVKILYLHIMRSPDTCWHCTIQLQHLRYLRSSCTNPLIYIRNFIILA
jgi:hypothetical protein